jgi:CHAT domain-containing protein
LKNRLDHEFASGKYDLVHYAGHAYFDDKTRLQSGILCAGNQVLSGRELATLDSLHALVVFNACESARAGSATLPNVPSVGLARGSGKSGGLALWGVGGTLAVGVEVCWALAIVVAAVRLAKVEGAGVLLI